MLPGLHVFCTAHFSTCLVFQHVWFWFLAIWAIKDNIFLTFCIWCLVYLQNPSDRPAALTPVLVNVLVGLKLMFVFQKIKFLECGFDRAWRWWLLFLHRALHVSWTCFKCSCVCSVNELLGGFRCRWVAGRGWWGGYHIEEKKRVIILASDLFEILPKN